MDDFGRAGLNPLRWSERTVLTPAGVPRQRTFETVQIDEFDQMSRAFMAHGGFVDVEEVTSRLRCLSDQPISRLARWIVSRVVISISWRARTLMPAFQFQFEDMSISPACTDVFAEFAGVFSYWEIVVWFSMPNVWLNGEPPVALLAGNSRLVLEAARADRFVARA